MCPDAPALSSFVDRELPPAAYEQVEAHVKHCVDCRARLRCYQSLSHRLLECDEPDVEEASLRVWHRFNASPGTYPRRRGSLRLPIAVASAAVAIAFVFTIALGDRAFTVGEWGRLPSLNRAVVTENLAPSYARSEGSMVLELELPETSEFQLFSSPKILHEVELQSGSIEKMEVKLPPAHYRVVGMPVIVHEGELETPK